MTLNIIFNVVLVSLLALLMTGPSLRVIEYTLLYVMKKDHGHGKSYDGWKEKSSSVKENPEKLTRIFESCILNMSRIYQFLAGSSVFSDQHQGIYVHGIPLQKPDIYSSGYWIYVSRVDLHRKSGSPSISPLPSTTASLLPISISRSWLPTTTILQMHAISSPSYKFSSNSILIDSICSISIYFQLFQHGISSQGPKRWGGKRLTLSTLWDLSACGFVFLRRNRALLGVGWPLVGAIYPQFRLFLLNL